MTAPDIDAIERAAQEALPREDLCGLCGCEDEPYFPKKWEGRNAVNCVRASRLKVQIAYIAAANPAAILSLIAEVRELRGRDERITQLAAEEEQDICQTLGKALGYPWYKDDPVNFPDATEAQGVCIGEHVAASLAAEAATTIVKLTRQRDEARAALRGTVNALRVAVAGTADPTTTAMLAMCEMEKAQAALAKAEGAPEGGSDG